MTELFAGIFARGDIGTATDDDAWLRALLDAEAALARAHARLGTIPPEHAEEITHSCVPENIDTAEVSRSAADSGNPVVPLVGQITRSVGEAAGRHVHLGATSQDIMDTAAMLVARRAGTVIRAVADEACESLATLAVDHRDTVMAGRTLLQQALPTTFGLAAAGWLDQLADATNRLAEFLDQRAAAQLGGAAGTLASLGQVGPRVTTAFASELGLAEPRLPWHTARGRVAELAGALAQVSGAVGKTAGDIVLLAQTEVGEVREHGGRDRGGSSTLPHKRNPVAAVSAVACAEQAPDLAGSLLGVQIQQHQRAAGQWQAEWLPLTRLLRTTGSAAAWLGTSLERLNVDPERMRANMLDGFPLAERVTTDLVGELGRLPAHELVRSACAEASDQGRDLTDVLTERLEGRRSREEVSALLDPTSYLGSAGEFIDRAVEKHHASGGAEVRHPTHRSTETRRTG
ncbi:3-carboxy-cis,cis-muconate cycloisomerase [Haloactinospora alba]|uniref:3-carboxy-cis,cis-muconate cycloisomerase n=1 Tax=Haloactinospora alba TaxID=405555 RepID=A0A543NGY9_9ACTN|nr:3-carboxy-cis,cis-muconate cycloisomerase [Haloactinospora alba]TQN31126.1 3-carboxy-cis,cis-muconate cycloisomerase [Haloactinospora alba]